jgi:predicted CDP-diglyceride synthetase/phosphatidate cytidylyltransferase
LLLAGELATLCFADPLLVAVFSSSVGQILFGVAVGVLLYRMLLRPRGKGNLKCDSVDPRRLVDQTIGVNVFQAYHVLLAILSVASVLAAGIRLLSGPKRELEARLLTWWIIMGSFYILMLAGTGGVLAYWFAASLLAFKEFADHVPKGLDKLLLNAVLVLAYVTGLFFPLTCCRIPLHFYLIYINWYTMYIIFIPTYFFLLVPLVVQFGPKRESFLRTCATVQYGMMCNVYFLSRKQQPTGFL